MTSLTHDAAVSPRPPAARRTSWGFGLAAVSALTFGMSGALAGGLLDAGWTPGAIVLVRIGLAAVVVLPLGLASVRGRWHLVRANALLVVAYGLLPVAGTQFFYFSAVGSMEVGPALLIEYTAPAAIVAYLWLRHGQAPSRTTLAGAAVAVVGLVLVLDLASGADLSLTGVLWSLAAMVGAATYFVMNADERNGLPPLAFAAGGLLAGTVALGAAGLVGLLPMHASLDPVTYDGLTVTWWVPVLLLGVVTAALAYVTGIAAGRHLGSRLSSFVALLEVVAAVTFAWLLLGELPGPLQLVGGLLILTGVTVVKLGERVPTLER